MDVLTKELGMTDATIAQKLVAFASDGASVMLGNTAGVATLLRLHYAPFLDNTHCLAHCGHVSFAVKGSEKKSRQ